MNVQLCVQIAEDTLSRQLLKVSSRERKHLQSYFFTTISLSGKELYSYESVTNLEQPRDKVKQAFDINNLVYNFTCMVIIG